MATGHQSGPSSTESDRPAKKVKFSPQVSISEFLAVPAKEAVTFHLLYASTEAELDAEIRAGGVPFSCEYFNQVFGDSEEINGYKGLEVHVWIALRSGHCWVDITYLDSQPGADDVESQLAQWWPQPFTTDRAQFLREAAAAPAHDFSTMGRQLAPEIAQKVGVQGAGQGGNVQLYHSVLADTPDWFKELHARLEPLLIFTIDGANFIDAPDPKWEVVVITLRRNEQQYMAGFLMLYNFYAWPDTRRPRVAQVLVVPTLQRNGYGRALVAAAYKLAKDRDAIDLTFEDPAPGLQLLREKLELEMMNELEDLRTAAQKALTAAAADEQKLQEAARRQWLAGASKQQQETHQKQQHEAGTATTQEAVQGTTDEQPPATAAGGAAASSSASHASHSDVPCLEGAVSPARHLVMPPDMLKLAATELKIHKHQALAVWEALLFLHSPLGTPVQAAHQQTGTAVVAALDPTLLEEPLTEAVTRRLERSTGPADKAAAAKKLVEVEGSEEDWFVYKLPRKLQCSVQQGALSDTVSLGRRSITGMNADDYSERLQELVSQRLDTLAVIKRRIISRDTRRQQQHGM